MFPALAAGVDCQQAGTTIYPSRMGIRHDAFGSIEADAGDTGHAALRELDYEAGEGKVGFALDFTKLTDATEYQSRGRIVGIAATAVAKP